MITAQQKAALTSQSPRSRNASMPDPHWKAQQAYIRATRRGSKKHATPEQKLALLDGAIAVIPKPRRVGESACPFCLPVGSVTFKDAVAWNLHVRAVHPADAERLDAEARKP